MEHSHVVTLQQRGVEYTVVVSFDPQLAAEKLLGRTIRNRSHRSVSCSGALTAKLIAQVPLK